MITLCYIKSKHLQYVYPHGINTNPITHPIDAHQRWTSIPHDLLPPIILPWAYFKIHMLITEAVFSTVIPNNLMSHAGSW